TEEAAAALRANGDIPALFKDVAGATSAPAKIAEATTPVRAPANIDVSPEERRATLRGRIAEECATMLSIAGAIDQRRPLQELGLDSLAALELRNRLGRLVGAVLPASLLFDHPTVSALTEYMAATYLGLPGGAPTTLASTASPAAVAIDDDLADASDADLDAALDAFEELHGERGARA
ncbi:MAG: acyl carrier protein, partial [Proteobacteria bacterium]|nr:acyl carrier protein [Pseudomonadota bacterium]